MNQNTYTDNPLVKQCGAHKVRSWLLSGAILGKTPEDFGFPEDFDQDKIEHRKVCETLGGIVRDYQDHGNGTADILPHKPVEYVTLSSEALGLRELVVCNNGTETRTTFTATILAEIGDGFLTFLLDVHPEDEDTGMSTAKVFGKVRDSRKNAMAAAQRKSKKMREKYVIVIHKHTACGIYLGGKLLETGEISL